MRAVTMKWWAHITPGGGVTQYGMFSGGTPVPMNPSHDLVALSADEFQRVRARRDNGWRWQHGKGLHRKREIKLSASRYEFTAEEDTELSWTPAVKVRLVCNGMLLDGEYDSPEKFAPPHGAGIYQVRICDDNSISNLITLAVGTPEIPAPKPDGAKP
ncbi:MAG: hypothetical protein ACREQ4_16800 [Candidatus Binataceae bacterium]